MTVVLAIIGLICILVAIIYFTVPAKSLPSFIPGRAAKSHLHHNRRGIAALVVGILFFHDGSKTVRLDAFGAQLRVVRGASQHGGQRDRAREHFALHGFKGAEHIAVDA